MQEAMGPLFQSAQSVATIAAQVVRSSPPIDFNNPVILTFGILAVCLNLLFSGGTLWKLIDFARRYGVMEHTVKTHQEEIGRLREFQDDLRDGKIPLATRNKT